MECKMCGLEEYTIMVTISVFGVDFSMPMCIWHRMECSGLIRWHKMENNMEDSKVYTMEDYMTAGGLPMDYEMENDKALEEYTMENDIEHSIREEAEYLMEYEGLDPDDAYNKALEDYNEAVDESRMESTMYLPYEQ